VQAKLVKLADKLYNLLDLERSLPLGNWFYHLTDVYL
jgi:hypothetical protein